MKLFPGENQNHGNNMRDLFNLELPALLHFFRVSCHESLHETLFLLREMADEVSEDQKTNPLFPKNLPHYLKESIREIQRHLAYEEKALYPLLENGEFSSDENIRFMTHDHESLGQRMEVIRQMTNDFSLPDNFDVKCLHFYKLLNEMERILTNHINIEDGILIPLVREELP